MIVGTLPASHGSNWPDPDTRTGTTPAVHWFNGPAGATDTGAAISNSSKQLSLSASVGAK
jgi:hypothetical protein